MNIINVAINWHEGYYNIYCIICDVQHNIVEEKFDSEDIQQVFIDNSNFLGGYAPGRYW